MIFTCVEQYNGIGNFGAILPIDRGTSLITHSWIILNEICTWIISTDLRVYIVSLKYVFDFCQQVNLTIVPNFRTISQIIKFYEWKSNHQKILLTNSGLIEFAAQIANGLVYLHRQNISHNDLFPKNILLTNHLICQIADFGFSRRLNKYGEYQ